MRAKTVIGVAGMPGTGKATVVEVGEKLGCGVVVMGDAVRDEVKHRGLDPTPENLGRTMLEMRKEDGSAAIARRCVQKIVKDENKAVIVDGIRSLYEVDEFKKHFPKFRLLAIHASPETRFRRLFKRKRSDDPAGWETFLERDWRELHVGLGSLIASADFMIVNEGRKGAFRSDVKTYLEKVLKSGPTKRRR